MDTTMIYRWVEKFREHWTVHNLNSAMSPSDGQSGRLRTVHSGDSINHVWVSLIVDPEELLRRRAAELGDMFESVRRILRNKFNCFPNKMSIKQKLLEKDNQAQLQMCR